ncbi:MAG: GNAT family N-acetyltransferase, partial [Meiothermus silvanus]|nr:GNAT family N-acetyltransferase [Allomeiothermus silvanus]
MLRAFERSDVPAILELWNRRWGNLFPLDEALWVQQTVGDPQHFRPDLARVAVEGQRIVGAVSLKT